MVTKCKSLLRSHRVDVCAFREFMARACISCDDCASARKHVASERTRKMRVLWLLLLLLLLLSVAIRLLCESVSSYSSSSRTSRSAAHVPRVAAATTATAATAEAALVRIATPSACVPKADTRTPVCATSFRNNASTVVVAVVSLVPIGS